MKVNFQAVLKSNHPAFIKMLAQAVIVLGYATPSNFFQNLSDADLGLLSSIMEKDYAEQEKAEAEEAEETCVLQQEGLSMMLLTAMLVDAEGYTPLFKDEEEEQQFYMRAYGCTRMFICLESLKRKGAVTVDYEAFTYDMDRKKVIAKVAD